VSGELINLVEAHVSTAWQMQPTEKTQLGSI